MLQSVKKRGKTMTDLVLLDLDGTLTDSQEGIINSIQYALKKHNIECPDSELIFFIGPPLKESFQKKFPQLDPEQAVADYREYYTKQGMLENKVYDGVFELLLELKKRNIKAAAATSKPEPYARKILEHFGLDQYLDGIYGATLDSSRVNKDAVIEYALENEKADHPIMVGDRKFDIEGAHAHHLPGIGVTYGFGDRKELEQAGADAIIDHPMELLQTSYLM